MIYLDVAKRIEELREKLHKSIDENGINAKETQKISNNIDKLVNEYYKEKKRYDDNNKLLIAYNKSIEALKQLTIDLRRFSKYENLDGIC